jgi:hypothetical protein
VGQRSDPKRRLELDDRKDTVPTSKLFTTKDVGLLTEALTLIPNLPIVTFAAKRAGERLSYPIKSREELAKLLDDGAAAVDGRTISAKDIETFVPDEFFPIPDQHALLCRLLIAFQRGDLFHEQELAESPSTDPIPKEATIIPVPTFLTPFTKKRPVRRPA